MWGADQGHKLLTAWEREHLRVWGADDADDPGDGITNDVDRQHLRVWGADDADDPNDGVNDDVTASDGNCFDGANGNGDDNIFGALRKE